MKELDINPKISVTKLAKKVRASQQVIDYRIKRLLKNRNIIKFGTIIDLHTLKQEHYRIFFNFHSHKKYSNKEIFNYLVKRKGVYWAARIGGRYDLHIALFVFDFEELHNFVNEVNQKFPGLIKDYKSCYGLEHFIYRHKYYGAASETIKYGYKSKSQKTDELDKYILGKIKDNCRTPSLEISDEKKVSYKTIINRIKSLEKKKIILGYRMFIKSDEKKPFIILISFKNYSQNEEDRFLSYLKNHKYVTQTIRLFGIWNVFIHARAENLERLQEMIIEFKNKCEIIDDYEIIPVFEDIEINLMPV